jgi:hypothetical protein
MCFSLNKLLLCMPFSQLILQKLLLHSHIIVLAQSVNLLRFGLENHVSWFNSYQGQEGFQTGCRARTSSCPVDTGWLFLRGKVDRTWIWSIIPSISLAKNGWSYTFAPQSGTGTGFSASTLISPSQCNSTIALYSFIHVSQSSFKSRWIMRLQKGPLQWRTAEVSFPQTLVDVTTSRCLLPPLWFLLRPLKCVHSTVNV